MQRDRHFCSVCCVHECGCPRALRTLELDVRSPRTPALRVFVKVARKRCRAWGDVFFRFVRGSIGSKTATSRGWGWGGGGMTLGWARSPLLGLS